MDWFQEYDVALDIPTGEIMFVIGRERIKTYVNFRKEMTEINCILMEESENQRHPWAEGLSAEILCNNIQEETDPELDVEQLLGIQYINDYLQKNQQVIFTDEKYATRT